MLEFTLITYSRNSMEASFKAYFAMPSLVTLSTVMPSAGRLSFVKLSFITLSAVKLSATG